MRFTTNQLTGLISIIAGRHGLRVARWRVLTRRHNTTVRLDASPIRTAGRSSAQATERFVLKIHEPGETSLAEIRSEMQWLAALAQKTDLLVPHPVATLDGRWVTEVDMPDGGQRYPCRLTRWVPGRILGRGRGWYIFRGWVS
jgi:hypothetical protein